MTDTSIQTKERLAWIGKMVQPAIVALLFALGGWIFMINSEIAAIKASIGENKAQWKALYEQGQRIEDLTIEVQVYQRMFRMLLEQEKIEIGRIYLPEVSKVESDSAGDEPPLIEESFVRKVDEFRRAQIQQTPNMPPEAKY